MARIAYVNGRYVPGPDAEISINDRGLQFGDSVYEVIDVKDARFMEYDAHLARLKRSLASLRLQMPVSERALKVILQEVQRRNFVRNGVVYVQVTRGIASRNHKFPAETVKASLIVTGTPIAQDDKEKLRVNGIRVITQPDDRWRRRDIKTTNLLPNVLAKQAAADAQAHEAWLVDDDGFVTEGSSSTAWIVTAGRVVITRPLSADILPGVTRDALLPVLSEFDGDFVERPFTVDEAEGAAEAFITSASNPVTPVVQINASILGDGTPGPVTRVLQQWFQRIRT